MIQLLIDTLRENEFAQGMVIPVIGGALFFVLRSSWGFISGFLKNFFSIDITMNTDWANYSDVAAHLYNHSIVRLFQRNFHVGIRDAHIHIETDVKEKMDKYEVSLGYGKSLAMVCGHLAIVTRRLEDSSATKEFKESIVINIFCLFGRRETTKKRIIDFLRSTSNEDVNQILVKSVVSFGQANYVRRPFRPKESVFLPEEDVNYLFGSIEKFLNSKEDFEKKNIPWTLGIVLYGPPGTGKTSLIQALASTFKRDIHFLTIAQLRHASPSAFNCIEDIDRQLFDYAQDSEDSDPESRTKAVTSDTLNYFDGMLSKAGSIFIITTNHIDHLDEALLRPGRFDVRLFLGLMQYPEFVKMCDHYEVQNPLTEEMYVPHPPAQLREMVLYRSPEYIVNFMKDAA